MTIRPDGPECYGLFVLPQLLSAILSTCQRCSGLAKSKRQPASHSERWLPWAGIPPASLSIRARCSRFHVMKVVLRLVKSLSGPPEPSSRYDGPGPASPIQPASACGGIVYPRCCSEERTFMEQCLIPSSLPVI